MDNYMPMSTTKRHNKFVNTLMNRIFNLAEKNEINALSEQCPLVYWGTKGIPSGFKLVDIKSIEDIKKFTEEIIYELDYVQPDFMLFKDNPYLKNSKGLRTAGRPDLIVEVWSESNSRAERELKLNLYASSDITEHLYIEQDSNSVQCHIGKKRLPEQCLTDILVTQKGLEFDLRYLAV